VCDYLRLEDPFSQITEKQNNILAQPESPIEVSETLHIPEISPIADLHVGPTLI
jgi:hypothetical protein